MIRSLSKISGECKPWFTNYKTPQLSTGAQNLRKTKTQTKQRLNQEQQPQNLSASQSHSDKNVYNNQCQLPYNPLSQHFTFSENPQIRMTIYTIFRTDYSRMADATDLNNWIKTQHGYCLTQPDRRVCSSFFWHTYVPWLLLCYLFNLPSHFSISKTKVQTCPLVILPNMFCCWSYS